MIEIKCPYDSTQKPYIITNNSWLKAIDKFIPCKHINKWSSYYK